MMKEHHPSNSDHDAKAASDPTIHQALLELHQLHARLARLIATIEGELGLGAIDDGAPSDGSSPRQL